VARIEPVWDEDASEDVRVAFDGARAMMGRVSNFIRTVAHSPNEVKWLIPFLVTFQREGDGTLLPGRLRELAIVKTSLLNACRY
jgi:hypothetical protein